MAKTPLSGALSIDHTHTVATLKQQDRNIVEYVVAAIEAPRTGQFAPSLLPISSLLVEVA
jgi:hypothetical protein